jgi:hypothetical protein
LTSKTLAVFRKELLDTLRDGRSVFAIFVFPFVLYPAMLLFIGWLQTKDREGASQIPVRVGIVNAAAFPTLADSVAAYPAVTPVALDRVPEDWQQAGVEAVLSIPTDVHERLARGDSVRVQLLYKDAENASSAAAQRIRPLLDHVRLLLSQSWARSHGAQVETLPAYVVERKDISSEAETGRSTAALIIPAVGNNKLRHETLQKFMLTNDSVTVAIEIPIWLAESNIAALEAQHGIELVPRVGAAERTITGHIDFLQVRNGAVHVLDYKPDARTNKPIAQLAIYALALTRLVPGLKLFDIKCAWFNEDEYCEIFPRTLFTRGTMPTL